MLLQMQKKYLHDFLYIIDTQILGICEGPELRIASLMTQGHELHKLEHA